MDKNIISGVSNTGIDYRLLIYPIQIILAINISTFLNAILPVVIYFHTIE